MSQKKFYFVYGTLKRGYGNHSLLEDSEFVGPAKTLESFVMVSVGYPYLFRSTGHPEKPVLGELYAVESSAVEQRLDWLEGIEHDHYFKETVEVECNGEIYKANIYTATLSTIDEIFDLEPDVTNINDGVYEWVR